MRINRFLTNKHCTAFSHPPEPAQEGVGVGTQAENRSPRGRGPFRSRTFGLDATHPPCCLSLGLDTSG